MSSGFVSEKDLDEARRKRQEEWDQVRSSDQPIEAPEVPYDSRSLFDRLQEQKLKKDSEYEEARKLKNMIKGLDDDEVDFLDFVDQRKLDEERRKIADEQMEIINFQKRVAELQEEKHEQRLHATIANGTSPSRKVAMSNRLAQSKLLKGSLIVKSALKRSADTSNLSNENESLSSDKKQAKTNDQTSVNSVNTCTEPPLKCIGILPGIGPYDSSSDSENSSDEEVSVVNKSTRDIIGRQIKSRLDSESTEG